MVRIKQAARALAGLGLVAATFAGMGASGVDAATPKCMGLVATQTLTSPGTLYFTPGNDVFIGSSGDDIFAAEGPQDAGGFDYVCAGKGNDEVYGSYENDLTADGGAGNDSMAASERSVLHGGSGNDILTANSGATAYGDAGNDTLFANNSSLAYGGSGNDSLQLEYGSVGDGGPGFDELSVHSDSTGYGGSGNDWIGGNNATAIYGGSGADEIANDIEDDHPGAAVDCGSGIDLYWETGTYSSLKRCEEPAKCVCVAIPNLNFFAGWIRQTV